MRPVRRLFNVIGASALLSVCLWYLHWVFVAGHAVQLGLIAGAVGGISISCYWLWETFTPQT